MFAQVEQVGCNQLMGRSRQQDLPAVCGAHDPGRLVHVGADVLGRIEQRFARVHAYPDPDRPVGERRHGLLHRRYSSRGRGKRVEEAVARVVDLITRVGSESVPDGSAVVRQHLAVSLCAEVVEQRCRALDVGEHERHGSRRLHRHSHRHMIRRAELPHKRMRPCANTFAPA